MGGILGASLAPAIAEILQEMGGLSLVGGYLTIAALISLTAVFLMRETREEVLA
jgi:hypothetical protein